jgi:hypothetical protein
MKPLEIDDEAQSVVAERCLTESDDGDGTTDLELLTLRDHVAKLLAHLPERERFVVEMTGRALREIARRNRHTHGHLATARPSDQDPSVQENAHSQVGS